MIKNRGMSQQLLRLLLLAGICAVLFLMTLHFCSDLIINNYFSGSKLETKMMERRISKFGDYISNHDISATDTEDLLIWCNKQPMVLMEIYRSNILYFNSNYSYADPLSEQNIEAHRYGWYSYYEVQFADGPAEVLLYSDESYILNTWVMIAEISFSGILFLAIVLIGIRKTIRYVYLLCDEIQIMGSGDLEHPVTVRGSNELGLLARELDQMRSALLYHRQKEQDMIKLNNEMITSLSHDLRTPLTKLLLYSEILQNNKYDNAQQQSLYLERIHEKGIQMKKISDSLLQYSLAKGERKMTQMQNVSFQEALFDRLSEMTDYLSIQGFAVECHVVWNETIISINELYLDRILDNIVSNIDKYAEKTSTIVICSVQDNQHIGISVKNSHMLYKSQSESNGVGIESIRMMMLQMDGICKVIQTKTAFEISVLFHAASLIDSKF